MYRDEIDNRDGGEEIPLKEAIKLAKEDAAKMPLWLRKIGEQNKRIREYLKARLAGRK